MDKKRMARNTIMSVMLQLLTVLTGLVLPRIILGKYGSDMNGLVSSINQFMVYLTLVESGLTQVAVVSLYKPLITGDTDELNTQLTTIGYFYRRTSILYGFLLIIVSLLYPLIVDQPYDRGFTSTLIIVLGLHSFIDFFFTGKYKVLLIADQKQYVISGIQILTTLLFFLVEVILLKIGVAIIWVKACIPITHFLQFIAVKIFVIKNYQTIDYHHGNNTSPLKARGSAILHQITGMVMSSTDITLLTLMGTGLKEISVYTVYNVVIAELNGFLNSITNAIVPSFGKAIIERVGKIEEQFKKFCGLYYYLTFSIVAPLFLMYSGFIKLYTSNVYDVVYVREALPYLFTVCFILNAIKAPYIMLIQSSGLYAETRKATMVEAIINLAFTIPLIMIMGINGALIGTICAHIYRYIELLHFGKKYFCISIIRSLTSIAKYVIVDAVLVIISISMIKPEDVSGWGAWLLKGIITTAITCSVNAILFRYTDHENFSYFYEIILGKIRRI